MKENRVKPLPCAVRPTCGPTLYGSIQNLQSPSPKPFSVWPTQTTLMAAHPTQLTSYGPPHSVQPSRLGLCGLPHSWCGNHLLRQLRRLPHRHFSCVILLLGMVRYGYSHTLPICCSFCAQILGQGDLPTCSAMFHNFVLHLQAQFVHPESFGALSISLGEDNERNLD